MSFPLDVSQYEIIRQIDEDEFCSTYVARCLANEKLVTLRKIDLEKNKNILDIIGKETRYWSTTSHPNMMGYYASFIDLQYLWVISEMIDQGSLLDILHFQHSDGIKDELLIASILQQILNFLKYYHEIHQVHRSLETQNIFVSQNGTVKVAGFWKARSFLKNGFLKKERDSVIDSSCYTAPELVEKGKGYSQKVDIWSLGIIAYELALGKTPYSDLEPLRQIKEILRGDPPSLSLINSKRRSSFDKNLTKESYNFSPIFCDFVSQCLNKDPNKRPSASDLLKHKFILLAKQSDYIYVNLMINLPPLSQRIELINKSKKEERNLNIRRASTDQNTMIPNDLPQKMIVKKGRFTLTYPIKRTTTLL